MSLRKDIEQNFRRLMEKVDRVSDKEAEEDFDNYSIPHPSMGMLSYREMVYVLIIHPIHHTYKVEQKLPN